MKFPDDFQPFHTNEYVTFEDINNILRDMEKRKNKRGYRFSDFCIIENKVILRSNGDIYVCEILYKGESK